MWHVIHTLSVHFCVIPFAAFLPAKSPDKPARYRITLKAGSLRLAKGGT